MGLDPDNSRRTVLGYSPVCCERWSLEKHGDAAWVINTEGGMWITDVATAEIGQHIVAVHNASVELGKAISDTRR